MTQEEKSLLLKDLCARLPYGVMIQIPELFYPQRKVTEKLVSINDLWHFNDDGTYIENVRPYLRPMSSMTEEEKRELQSFYPGSLGNQWLDTEKGTIDISECSSTITLYLYDSERIVDWLNKNMFDYRGLIDKGLALEASEGMYNLKEK